MEEISTDSVTQCSEPGGPTKPGGKVGALGPGIVSSSSANGSSIRRRCWDEAFASGSESSTPEPGDDDELPLENVEGVDMCSSTTDGVQAVSTGETSIICEAHPGCLKTFASVREYEDHYNLRHRHKCITCRKSLPSAHILELHVLEAHDTYFSLMAERKPMLACFLESCTSKFWKPDERKDHCLSEHGFPKSFKLWDLTATSSGNKQEKRPGSKSKQGGNGKAVNKQNQKQKNKNQANSNGRDNDRMHVDSSASSGEVSSSTVTTTLLQNEPMDINTPRTQKNGQQQKSSAKPKQNSEKTKTHEKSIPVQITFGHSASRAFKPKYAFGLAKAVPEKGVDRTSASSKMDLDLSDIKNVLPATTCTDQ